MTDLDRLYVEKVLPLYVDQPNYPLERTGRADAKVRFYIEKLLIAHGISDLKRHIVDLGAGFSPFGVLLRVMGFEMTIVDDFGGGGEFERGYDPKVSGMLDRFTQLGVKVIEQDLLTRSLPMPDRSVDVVTTFHCIEHWHHSPRLLFGEIRRILRDGGLLIIGCPNPVNIRKRMSVLMGKSNLCSVEEWYVSGDPIFRGHVREPTVDDLITLARWNGFGVRSIVGANFLARASRECSQRSGAVARGVYQSALSLLDPLLRLRPGLCSDIHLVAEKKADEAGYESTVPSSDARTYDGDSGTRTEALSRG
jgi:SAM-dependent methyltransferase